MRLKISWKELILLTAVSVLLFLGFYRNQYHIVTMEHFSIFQKDSESIVLGRLVESRQHGLFSNGALLGWGDADPLALNEVDYDHQYETYLNGGGFETYSLYESQAGWQALFFGALDRMTPFDPATNMRLFRFLASALLAVTLGFLALWVYREFGLTAALTMFVTSAISQWLTFFGRNLLFFTWTFYLAPVLLLFLLEREARGAKLSEWKLAGIIAALAFFKCMFSGYDFILPALVSLVIPFSYFSIRDKWGWVKFAQRFSFAVLAALAALAVSLVILSFQVGAATGNALNGFDHIANTISRRTLLTPEAQALTPLYQTAQAASVSSVIKIYLFDKPLINILGLRAVDLIGFFVVLTLLYFLVARWRSKRMDTVKGYAILAMTWFSILSPLSWFILFKATAYLHIHSNYIVWNMPFTLIGFAMSGYVLEQGVRAVRAQ
jgi:hypothetical protein